MGADLHIHSCRPITHPQTGEELPHVTDDDLECFFSSTLGSRWFNLADTPCRPRYDCPHWQRIEVSDSVFISEVSFLKAALTGDTEAYIPEPALQITKLFSDEELVSLTPELAAELTRACPSDDELVAFIERNMGHKLFTVAW